MSIAQQLYEGVNVTGEGSIGLITYMRTDSLRISAEAIAAAKDHIVRNYGSEYYPPKTRYFKTSKEAQDAHEAIRPSDVELTPERIRLVLGEALRIPGAVEDIRRGAGEPLAGQLSAELARLGQAEGLAKAGQP